MVFSMLAHSEAASARPSASLLPRFGIVLKTIGLEGPLELYELG